MFVLFWSVSFVFVELSLRVYHGRLLSFELLDMRETPISTSHQAYHELLGYLPIPGERVHPDGWTAHIDEDRLRLPGRNVRPEGVPWLAIGDSFAFGDEVEDDETWPAELERLTGRRVLNAGVFGYGLDQVVLRAEHLLERFSPEIVILSLVSGDINRCERSFSYHSWKPYFDVRDGQLELSNIPVPTGTREVSLLRRGVGWSYAFRGILRRSAATWWYLGRNLQVHDRGDEVTRLLMDRLARAADRQGARLLVVTLTDRDLQAQRLPALLAHLERSEVPVLDLVDDIRAIARERGVDETFMPKRHLNPAMNRWVASRIAAFLQGGQVLNAPLP